MQARLVLGLLAVLLAVPSVALASPPLDCSTPRNAVETLFGWLQPDSLKPENAARCLEPAGRTPDQLGQLAVQAKAVFDGRVLYVRMEELSESPDFKNDKGEPRAVVHAGLPEVYVERQADGQWRWSRASLDRLESIYQGTYSALGDRVISRIPDSLKGSAFGVAMWQYLALTLLFLVGLLVRKVLQFVVANRVQNLVAHFGKEWATKLVAAFDSPGATLVMAAILAAAYPQLRLPIHAAKALAVAVHVLITVSIVWAAYRLVDVFGDALAIRAARTESKLDDQLVPLVRRSLKVVTVIVGALFVLQNLDVDVGSLLAGLGIGGLALAMAAKDTLANFFGSIMIFADKPFQVGDWVVVDGVEGVVEEVGFRSTRVRTFYNSLVTVPNSKIADTKVDNYGARKYRRTHATLNLTYDTTPEQMQAFVEGVRAIIRANPFSRKDYYEVHFTAFGAHSLDVMLYFFFQCDSWSVELRERHNVYLEILRLAKALGVSFAFPTQTLHHDYVAQPGAPRSLPEPLSPERLGEAINALGPRGNLARPAGPRITSGWFADQPDPEPAPAEGRAKSA